MRRLHYVGTSYDDLAAFPHEVQTDVFLSLQVAVEGGKAPNAKPLKGFGGSSVVEIVESFDGDAYRAVYTVRFKDAVYVLHAFKKKSKSGIATTKRDLDLIRRRLKEAESRAT